jgi:excisionase family DNA binding protein
MRSSYSTADLARMLEVNESTVKRWADSGHIECVRTKGGHRRFPVSAVLKFAQENKFALPAFDASVLTDIDVHAHVASGNISRLVPELRTEALAGNIEGALQILRVGLTARPDLLRLYHDLVFPPLVEIGDSWAQGKLTVDEEHLASQTMKEAVVRLQSEVHQKPSNSRTVIAACYENDLHDIGLRCAANYFASEGWRVVFLGQSTPTDSLVHAIAKQRPNLVILSTVVCEDDTKFIRDVNERIAPEVHAVNGFLDIGGANVKHRFGSTVRADSFTERILDYEAIATSDAE